MFLTQLLLSMPAGAEWILILLGFAMLLAFIGFWIYTIVDIANSKFVDDTSKIVWLLVVVLTGIVGSIIYWIFGRSSRVLVDKG
ncbi:MAG: PLDc N-terminal domain-containing protein [Ferruginibacter sp.]